MKIKIGHDRVSRKPVYIPLKAVRQHLHYLGASGSGKTTAIITFLAGLLTLAQEDWCVVLIDRLGGFSHDVLRWAASEFCPEDIRRRLLYIEAAREDMVVPMNPLLHRTPGECYYRTSHTAELLLRGWSAQDISQMPRLARWLHNSLHAVALLGLTIGDAVHLITPHSPLHRPLLQALPEQLRWEWDQILRAGTQAEVQLESCRNRLKPVFESPGLRAMFSSSQNRYDVVRWQREGRLVVLNLAPLGTLPPAMADAIAGLTVNEVFTVARSTRPERRVNTLLVLDEFQRFVSPDLELALAESRQLKTYLLLSHQSLGQLRRGKVDLTNLIFQAQTRLALHVDGPDAELMAEELAGFTHDPYRVKEENYRRCQRISGHRIIELHSQSFSEQTAQSWNNTVGAGWSSKEQVSRSAPDQETRGEGTARQGNTTQGSGESTARGSSQSTSESLLPVYEEYLELASRTFWSFDESKQEWAKKLRRLKTGQGVLRLVGDDELHEIDVRRTAPGHLAFEWDTVLDELPDVAEDFERLCAENFAQDFFLTPSQIERETRDRLERVLVNRIEIRAAPQPLPAGLSTAAPPANDGLL